jgi:hypothetical protein
MRETPLLFSEEMIRTQIATACLQGAIARGEEAATYVNEIGCETRYACIYDKATKTTIPHRLIRTAEQNRAIWAVRQADVLIDELTRTTRLRWSV